MHDRLEVERALTGDEAGQHHGQQPGMPVVRPLHQHERSYRQERQRVEAQNLQGRETSRSQRGSIDG
jgi:hypothetical protein